MPDELISLTIDDVPVSVPKGTLVIEAAKQAGVLVPHYCYHPGLAVAGVCRMCLVEVEKAPKLQIACATTVAEGMVVRTQSEQAKQARMGVRSEEHTSELQSRLHLVCRLLLEKKK